MTPCSSERAHADDYDRRHGKELDGWMLWCEVCENFKHSTRDVTVNGVVWNYCRSCRPFDHPCDCGKGDCLPGTQECLACALEEDLREVRAEIAGAM